MKKIFGTVLAIVLASSILAGCGKDEPTGAAPEATDAATENTTPFATEDMATGAGAATEGTETAKDAAAIDLTAYPVMWCRELPLYPDRYDDTYWVTLTSEVYERNFVMGTEWSGYRLIDDTHIEFFSHFRFNDDIDTSLMVTSQDESIIENDELVSVTRISDREEEVVTDTYTYEINGTELIITYETYEQTSATFTLQFSSDFTSLDGKYTYLTDF